MFLSNLVRRLTLVGGILVFSSYPMHWVSSVTGSLFRPFSVLILAAALVAISLLPEDRSQRQIRVVIYLSLSVTAIVITFWSLMQTIFILTHNDNAQLGPGAAIAMIGSLSFVFGSIAVIQIIGLSDIPDGL